MSQEKGRNQQDKDKEPKRARLPSSGLADEILDSYKRAAPDTEGTAESRPRPKKKKNRPRSTPPQSAQPRAAERRKGRNKAADPTAEAPLPEAALPDLDKVYAFADELETGEAPEPATPDEEPEPYVTFKLARETFAFPVRQVREVVKVTPITRVPHTPTAIRGVMNRRGGVLPVLDLRLRFGLQSSEVGVSNRVLVMVSGRRLTGVLVDSVLQVAQFLPSAIEAPPSDVMNAHSEYVRGVYQTNEGLVILLDADQTLDLQTEQHEDQPSAST